MSLTTLHLRNVRNLVDVRIDPGPGLNWLHGENGAGKTSVLEAIHLLARGRSFRSGSPNAVIRDGEDALSVFARRSRPEVALGVERMRGGWRGRIDGRDTNRVSDFAERLPLVLIEPRSHQLLAGGPDVRRSFLDWALFHVEHEYLDRWKRYARLLRQRNAALKQGGDSAVLDALEPPMADAAHWLDAARVRCVDALTEAATAVQASLALRLPALEFRYRPASGDGEAYDSSLRASRARDREQGFTSVGPHRAELVIRSGGRMAAPRLSRGQEKLAALLLKLAELRILPARPCAPILLIDDPVSELDARHLAQLVDWLASEAAQVWITAVEPPRDGRGSLFHVEQGEIRPGGIIQR